MTLLLALQGGAPQTLAAGSPNLQIAVSSAAVVTAVALSATTPVLRLQSVASSTVTAITLVATTATARVTAIMATTLSTVNLVASAVVVRLTAMSAGLYRRLTQLWPSATPGERYSGFAGKSVALTVAAGTATARLEARAAVAVPSTTLIASVPIVRVSALAATVAGAVRERLTHLWPLGTPGERYGVFAGKTVSLPTESQPLGLVLGAPRRRVPREDLIIVAGTPSILVEAPPAAIRSPRPSPRREATRRRRAKTAAVRVSVSVAAVSALRTLRPGVAQWRLSPGGAAPVVATTLRSASPCCRLEAPAPIIATGPVTFAVSRLAVPLGRRAHAGTPAVLVHTGCAKAQWEDEQIVEELLLGLASEDESVLLGVGS